MTTSENKNTSTAIPNPEYYAAKKVQYAAEERDAKETPARWPSVVTVTDPADGKKRAVYTNVD